MTTMGERLLGECRSQMIAVLAALDAEGQAPGLATILEDDDLRILVQLVFRGADDAEADAVKLDVFHTLGHLLAGYDALVFTVDVAASLDPVGDNDEPRPRPRHDPGATDAILTTVVEYLAATHQLAVRQYFVPYRRLDDGRIDLDTPPETLDRWMAPEVLAAIADGAAHGAAPILDCARDLDALGQVVYLSGPGFPDPAMN